MNKSGKCRFYEWDEDSFALPDTFKLHNCNELADALNVFYAVGGYAFFNVTEPDYYASNWLAFVGNLFHNIMDKQYHQCRKSFIVPLTIEQKQELLARGVPEVFLTDIL